MSFWSDASGVTKGAIVVGAIGIVVIALLNFGVIGGGDEAPTAQTRGIQVGGGGAEAAEGGE